MKMKEAWFCHLPIEYSSSYKSSLSGCDSSSYSITNITITVETRRVLPCDHVYHNIYFSWDGSKCLHCLNYIKDGIDKYVQLLLDNLCRLKSNNNIESKESDSISKDNYNDTKKSANGISAP